MSPTSPAFKYTWQFIQLPSIFLQYDLWMTRKIIHRKVVLKLLMLTHNNIYSPGPLNLATHNRHDLWIDSWTICRFSLLIQVINIRFAPIIPSHPLFLERDMLQLRRKLYSWKFNFFSWRTE